MILGILAFVLAWIPGFGLLLAMLLVAVGLPLSISNFRNVRRESQDAGMATAGMVINIIAAAIALLWFLFIAVAFGPFFLGSCFGRV